MTTQAQHADDPADPLLPSSDPTDTEEHAKSSLLDQVAETAGWIGTGISKMLG